MDEREWTLIHSGDSTPKDAHHDDDQNSEDASSDADHQLLQAEYFDTNLASPVTDPQQRQLNNDISDDVATEDKKGSDVVTQDTDVLGEGEKKLQPAEVVSTDNNNGDADEVKQSKNVVDEGGSSVSNVRCDYYGQICEEMLHAQKAGRSAGKQRRTGAAQRRASSATLASASFRLSTKAMVALLAVLALETFIFNSWLVHKADTTSSPPATTTSSSSFGALLPTYTGNKDVDNTVRYPNMCQGGSSHTNELSSSCTATESDRMIANGNTNQQYHHHSMDTTETVEARLQRLELDSILHNQRLTAHDQALSHLDTTVAALNSRITLLEEELFLVRQQGRRTSLTVGDALEASKQSVEMLGARVGLLEREWSSKPAWPSTTTTVCSGSIGSSELYSGTCGSMPGELEGGSVYEHGSRVIDAHDKVSVPGVASACQRPFTTVGGDGDDGNGGGSSSAVVGKGGKQGEEEEEEYEEVTLQGVYDAIKAAFIELWNHDTHQDKHQHHHHAQYDRYKQKSFEKSQTWKLLSGAMKKGEWFEKRIKEVEKKVKSLQKDVKEVMKETKLYKKKGHH